ncbi:class I SAM-dependent methyltransferase [Heyndrickxia sp. MSNUG]|uniref:class I SAM-dependent methyltransferase n=1 Tax=Heyndrickxia sp. MSNUG TaxID=3136677 RepID=UPI003C2F0D2F
MFVTTAGRTNEEITAHARKIADDLNAEFVPRKKRSIFAIQEKLSDHCLVISKERLELYPFGEKEPFFFHPNSAMFRIKRLMNGENDPLIQSGKLAAGMSFLDCTLGLGSDSIVASYAVGTRGYVTGVEARPELSYLVKTGLKSWDSGYEAINQAMANINVVNEYSHDFLKKLDDDSFDCVYFDPMFDESIFESDGIRGLSHFAVYEGLSKEMMDHALRVAKKRVILKDHFRSTRFDEFGFKVNRRKSAKFHFGVIEKE